MHERRGVLPWGLVDVRGASMSPTLHPGDVLLVRWGARVRDGDVVVLRRPDLDGLLVVKRLAGRVGGGWWALGDLPAASTDSRHFGPVPDALVLARVLRRRPWLRAQPVLRAQPAPRRRAR